MRVIAISAIYLGLSAATIAQKPPASIVIRDAKDLRAYVISFVKPEYPFELRRRIGRREVVKQSGHLPDEL